MSRELQIEEATLKDGGYYYCYGHNHSRKFTSVLSQYLVVIQGSVYS